MLIFSKCEMQNTKTCTVSSTLSLVGGEDIDGDLKKYLSTHSCAPFPIAADMPVEFTANEQIKNCVQSLSTLTSFPLTFSPDMLRCNGMELNRAGDKELTKANQKLGDRE